MRHEPRAAGGCPRRRHAKQCRSFRAGHTIHWIQARKAAEDRTGREPGEVVETGEGWLLVRLDDGSHRRYGNHDIPRLEQLLEEHGTRVEVQERWGCCGSAPPDQHLRRTAMRRVASHEVDALRRSCAEVVSGLVVRW
jgi:hypothetical protein